MAASSFGGTNIRIELGPDGSAPTWVRQGYTATRHVPGSDTDVTQVFGLGSKTLQARLWVNSTEWAALEPKLLTTGTLIVAGTSMGTALLEALQGTELLPTGWVVTQATFRLVS